VRAVRRPIHSVRVVGAPPEVVHDLLADASAWRAWAPRLAWADPPPERLSEGWSGRVRARSWPTREVTILWAEPPRGVDWESRAAWHRLVCRQRVGPHEAGSRVTFTAELEGPVGPLLTRLVRPLAEPAQRHALARLGVVAEVLAARREPAPAAPAAPAAETPAARPG
jgi:hypothetical protein